MEKFISFSLPAVWPTWGWPDIDFMKCRSTNLPPDDDAKTIDSVLVKPFHYLACLMSSNRIDQINHPIEQSSESNGSYHLSPIYSFCIHVLSLIFTNRKLCLWYAKQRKQRTSSHRTNSRIGEKKVAIICHQYMYFAIHVLSLISSNSKVNIRTVFDHFPVGHHIYAIGLYLRLIGQTR